MKRLSTLALALLLLAGGAPALAATTATDTIALQRVTANAEKRVKRTNLIHFDLKADLPSEQTALTDSVKAWLSGLLATQLDAQPAGAGTGAQEMADYYGKQFVARGKDDIGEMLKYRKEAGDSSRITYSFNVELTRAYETGQFVTFTVDAYCYTGGAHGMHYVDYATFVKADGRTLTWADILNPRRERQFRALVADELRGYFGVKTFAEMRGRLLIEGKYTRQSFPLPAGRPGLLKDGLAVQYADYEIAAHAAGMPSVTIPYARMRGLWSPLAVKLWR